MARPDRGQPRRGYFTGFRMDERWVTHVFSILPVLIEVLIPLALLERLYYGGLIALEELQRLLLAIYDDTERSRRLLVSILPKKGPDSFDRFIKVLKETEGQEHVAQLILGTRKKHEQRRTVGVEKGRNKKI